MTALPSNLSYGTVVGQFIASVADSSDPDRLPDSVPLGGTITFTPSVSHVRNIAAQPNPVTIIKTPITGVLDSQGYLCGTDTDPETGELKRGLTLVASDNPDLNPTGWTYSVSYKLTLGDKAASSPAPHAIEVKGGDIIDLAQALPVVDSTGTAVVRGPQGEPGLDGKDGRDGVNGQDGSNGRDGQDGADGRDGVDGKDGVSLYKLKGYVDTLEELPAGGVMGDGWYVEDQGSLYLWGEEEGTWVANGHIRGPAGPEGPQGVPGPSGTAITEEPTGDLTWSGHQWNYRTDHGAPQYNGAWESATGASVDANGYLHLKIQRAYDYPYGTEIISTRGGLSGTQWGYGTYRFVVGNSPVNNYSNVILGMFTYDGTPGAPIHNNEIDIEAGGWSWGAPAWDHTYFRAGTGAEPAKQPVGMVQFPTTIAPVTTHEFEWTPGKIVWRSWLGENTTVAPFKESTAVHGQAYAYANTNGNFTGVHNIPVPRNEHVILNLWVTEENPGSPAADTPETEMIIRSFEFEAFDPLDYALNRENHYGTIPAPAKRDLIKRKAEEVWDFPNGIQGTPFTSTVASGGTVAAENPFLYNVSGVVRCMATSTGSRAGFMTHNGAVIAGGTNVVSTIHRVQLPVLPTPTDDLTSRFGLLDSITDVVPTDGFWFECTAATPNWQLVMANNGVLTTVNSGVSVNIDWHTFEVRVTGTAKAEYFIDGVLAGTISTGLPWGTNRGFGIGGAALKTSGTNARSLRWDYIIFETEMSESR